MKKHPGIEAIEARKTEIDAQVAELLHESEELEVALRVYQRFTEQESAPAAEGTKLGPPRPEGIPTLFQMAYEVVRDAELKGEKGLPAKKIVEQIGRRYWPGLQGQQVFAPLYTMAKKGRFRKTSNGLFQTVRTKEAPAEESEGASKSGSDGDRISNGSHVLNPRQ